MRFAIPAVLIVGSLMVGTAWAQSSSSGGGGSGGGAAGGSGTGTSSGSTAPATGEAASADNPMAVPRLRQGARTPLDRDTNIGRTPVQNRPNTAPTPPPGNEGSTGGARAGGADATTTGGISGTKRRPGEPSAIGPSPREEELLREGEQLEQKARRGVCEGC
ncbi:hypothetical protein [Microvirga makkahensis]|uniref:Uncharacterized protein n=1 Tax=Microvirga makkahensis TaxID=1128670 RepID=A0A7X3MW31_9HYPH|nr:hypothetical protein [Microvirga makkahensis]MXQ14113.1 hypothetical protein [Microvirga makkahensis]